MSRSGPFFSAGLTSGVLVNMSTGGVRVCDGVLTLQKYNGHSLSLTGPWGSSLVQRLGQCRLSCSCRPSARACASVAWVHPGPWIRGFTLGFQLSSSFVGNAAVLAALVSPGLLSGTELHVPGDFLVPSGV